MKRTRKNADHNNLSKNERYFAAALAVVWIIAGIIGLWTFISDSSWLGIVISILAIVYGFLWIRVAYTGRKLSRLLSLRSDKPPES